MIDQFHTPLWLAEAIVDRYFPDLNMGDTVLEPTCGTGSFLQAIPAYVPAVGIELDPVLAAQARERTGREVVVGDCRIVAIDFQPTAIIGNPPFKTEIIDAFMARAHELLPDGGRVGFLLPAYYLQNAKRVQSYSEQWSISQEMIPRNAFHGRMRVPLTFALFSKDRRRTMVGFAFYHETVGVNAIDMRFQYLLRHGQPNRSAWRAVVNAAMDALGGRASLVEIYRLIEGRRPTRNRYWREKVRQVLQQHYVRTAPATYARAA